MKKIIAVLLLSISICRCDIFVCPTSYGHYSHPNDKHKFYECSNWVAKEFVCPDGLIYDITLQVCNFDTGEPDDTTLANPSTVSATTTTSSPTTSTAAPTTTTLLSTTTDANSVKCKFSFRNCAPNGSSIHYNSAVITPCPIKHNDPIKLVTDVEILRNISSGKVMLETVLEKTKPERFQFPCINGFGSCLMNVCTDDTELTFSEIFSPFGANTCHIAAGKYLHHETSVPVPPIDPLITMLLEGEYEGNGTLFDEETHEIYGCFHLHFSIEN